MVKIFMKIKFCLICYEIVKAPHKNKNRSGSAPKCHESATLEGTVCINIP